MEVLSCGGLLSCGGHDGDSCIKNSSLVVLEGGRIVRNQQTIPKSTNDWATNDWTTSKARGEKNSPKEDRRRKKLSYLPKLSPEQHSSCRTHETSFQHVVLHVPASVSG